MIEVYQILCNSVFNVKYESQVRVWSLYFFKLLSVGVFLTGRKYVWYMYLVQKVQVVKIFCVSLNVMGNTN